MHSITRRHLLGASAALSLSRALGMPLSQLPLGVTTDEIDDDVMTAIKFLREFKLNYAEIRNVWGKYNTEQPADKMRELRKMFDENQMKVSILGTGFFKIPLPPDTPEGRATLDNQWSLLDRAMERAKIVGTDKIRVFAFTLKGDQKATHADYMRILELSREAAKRAKARGFRLAMENVGNSYVWRGADAGKFLKQMKEDNYGLTWDPNNAGETGEKSFPDGYKNIDPARIFHVHLRDFRKTAAGKYEWCAVGEGEMDNLGQIRALLRDGFKGTFTLETH